MSTGKGENVASTVRQFRSSATHPRGHEGMTLAADRGYESTERVDRRRAAAEPRRSWASSQPFVVRPTPFNDEDARAHHWPQVAGVYRRNVLLIDATLAT